MNLKLFKSGLLVSSMLLASCGLRTTRHQAPAEVPVTEAHASTDKVAAPAAEAVPTAAPPAEEIVAPVTTAGSDPTSALDDGPKIELKPAKGGKSTKAIEITDVHRSGDQGATPAETAATSTSIDVVAADTGMAKDASLNNKTSHAVEVAGVEPTQAFKWMQNGNRRFVKGFLRADGQTMKDVQRLAKSQRPHTIVLSCSDSRVPPELVFDQKLGEIFTIRTAGEVADDNVIASIEYAIAHLGPRLLVVMGHTSCGAVKAAVSTLDGSDAGSPSLNHMVSALHPHIREVLAEGKAPSNGFEREGWAAANGVAADLMKRSGIIAGAVKKGQLLVKVGLYHLDSGVVDFQ